MKVTDFNGIEISRGIRVKYIGTHTIGKVEKIIKSEGLTWIKLDSNGLLYRSDYIEVIEGKRGYIKPKKSKRSKIKSKHFNIEIPVEISETSDGPGIGGG
ncbi:MAG: DUF2098 family protein [Methanobacterium sp.]